MELLCMVFLLPSSPRPFSVFCKFFTFLGIFFSWHADMQPVQVFGQVLQKARGIKGERKLNRLAKKCLWKQKKRMDILESSCHALRSVLFKQTSMFSEPALCIMLEVIWCLCIMWIFTPANCAHVLMDESECLMQDQCILAFLSSNSPEFVSEGSCFSRG